MQTILNMSQHHSQNRRFQSNKKIVSSHDIANTRTKNSINLEDFKKVPYARLDVGIGIAVPTKLSIDNVISISGGMGAITSIEIEKGSVQASIPKAIVHVDASVNPDIMPEANIYIYNGIELDQNLLSNPNVFTSTNIGTSTDSLQAFRNTSKSRLVKALNLNVHGLIISGEVGVDLDELSEILDSLPIHSNKNLKELHSLLEKVKSGVTIQQEDINIVLKQIQKNGKYIDLSIRRKLKRTLRSLKK